jgi:hypothetical protein
MNEEGLPSLPEGWEWRRHWISRELRAASKHTDVDVEPGIDGGIRVIVPSLGGSYSSGDVPLAVILAVAKANGAL